jgi:hypothetical protein
MAGRAMAVPALEIQPADAFTLRMHRTPDIQIAEAEMCANALIAAVKRHGWAQNFGGKKDHLYYEAWAFVASMYRVSARIRPEFTKSLELCEAVGFEACAEAVHGPSQTILGVATSMCMDDEENWDTRPVYKKGQRVGERAVPLFQLRSMAETRACSKALRLVFSPVVAMAGYAPTPTEELTGNETGSGAREPQQRQQERGTGLISPKQASRLWAVAYSAGIDKGNIPKILRDFGFASAEAVTADKYDEIISFLERGAK